MALCPVALSCSPTGIISFQHANGMVLGAHSNEEHLLSDRLRFVRRHGGRVGASAPTRVFIALSAAILATTMSVVAFAAPANAAVITGVITDVDVSPTNPKIGESVRTDIDWCIPNGTHAGDTFTLTLSEYLRGLPTGFDLRDGDGGPVVATASISTSTPAVITFTMTAYAESHINVCGSAFIRSGFDNSLPAGVTVPFESTDGGGQTWQTPITPQPGDDGPSVDEGVKFGGFPTPDNGHTDPNDAIGWTILTPQGPLNSVVITDTVADGQNIDCATVTVLMGPRQPVNIGSPIVPAPIITPLVCTPESLSVTVGPLADGQAVRVRFMIDLDAPTGPGSHGFTNTATIVSTHPNGDVQTDTPRANIGSNDGGGDGGGDDTTPEIDIIKFATADGPVDGTFDEAPGKQVPAGTPVPVTMTITNTGDEPLKDVTVSDTTDTGPAMTGLTCDFSALGGPATGTTWAGPLAVDASFDCTGTVPALPAGVPHADTADVVGTGTISLIGVDDDDPFTVTPPPPTPGIEIVKGDSDGNAADTSDTRVTLPSNGTASLVFTITNTGDEALRNVVVSDTVVSNGTVTGLSCTFPDGSVGTTWAGPLAIGASFDCTASLSGVTPGPNHEDVATVTAIGVISGTPVDSKNPYFGHVRPIPVTPTASTPPIELAHTGSGAMPVAVVSALLLVLGAVLVARRRLTATKADKA